MSLVAGVTGMMVSYRFLASAHQLDVIAGAAGFVAGSILVAGALISIAICRKNRPDGKSAANAIPPNRDAEPRLDEGRWLAYFDRNRQNRPEPDWKAPITLSKDVIRPLVKSLEEFQLGDGGGPAYLIAWNRERFLAQTEGTRQLVDLWFAEEREHARLLAGAVQRFGGQCIQGHWTFTAFCLTRKWLGVRFELTVLLLTEIVSTVYYRLILRHAEDPPLRSMCRLIIRDETGHVSFHRDRLARSARSGSSMCGGRLWNVSFRLLGLVPATVLWISHAPGLRALGANRSEYYREIWLELSRFVERLRRESACK
jgi:hypothetical protein